MLQYGFAFFFPCYVRIRFIVYRLPGGIIEDADTGAVLKHKTIAECGVGKGVCVVAGEDVAAVLEVLMGQVQLG